MSFFVIFVFSLLFLLVRRQVVEGCLDVSVSSGPWRYVGRMPVSDQFESQRIHRQVAYIRSLAAL